ncbi:TerC family protein [Candidatus Methylopumilus universalis]|jgi:predicted tellurium resistance membrane protein TerC|uniref:TerC family protein n=1 Tax=Candidatus Methylopumilus universalis TaxID=2588536 RepID=UPI001123955C|nr:TerC family protein [Candidatus Methylopumilus universalis]QDC70442.1 TerC family protein [Candidatus Methylopumilus universalis]
MLEFILDPNTIIAFLTLVALEIVLGIDNIIFISVLANRLPIEIRESVRRFGLLFALITRVLLLLSLSWVMGLTEALFSFYNQEISGRDLILFFGGLFLLWKASKEIYLEVEAEEKTASEINASSIKSKSIQKLFWGSIFQIGILDIVFSLDSVITAVGLVDEISIMVAAVLISVIFMLWAAKPIGDFVHHHPSIKVLALSFLMIVGFVLIAESLDVHIPKGYIYFAMAFSLGVEVLNIRARQKKGG